MVSLMRVVGVLVMVVIPGGLLVLLAFVLGKVVANGVKHEQGTRGRRLARAVARVRLRDVWREAKTTTF